MTGNYYSLLQERLKNPLYPSHCLLLQGILRLTWPVIRLWSDYNWFTTFNQPNIIFVFCPQFWRYFCQDRMNVCGRNRSVLMFLHCIPDNSSHSSLYGNIKLTFLHKNTCISTVSARLAFQSNLWQKDIFSQTGLFLPISARWPWLLISEAQTGLLSNTAEFVFLTGMPKAHTHFQSRKSYQTLSKTFSAPLIHSSSYWYMHISMNAICQATSFLCQLILFDLCQFQNHLCPIRITYLPLVCPLWLKFCTTNLLLLFNNSQTSSEFQILIYTLDPWPLTEPDRFQSTTTHVSMPCPPPFPISTAQYSFLKWYALTRTCFQTLNPSFLVHMANHMVLWWIELPSNQP